MFPLGAIAGFILPMFSGVKGKIFLYVGLPIIITLFTLGTIKYHNMVSLINAQAKEIAKLKHDLIVANVDLETEKFNNNELTITIKDLNNEIKKVEVKNAETTKEFEEFKKKTNAEKYKLKSTLELVSSNLWHSTSCEDGLKLNEMISKLKYKDL